MKLTLPLFALAASLVLSTAHGATPEQEKAFVDAYKTALEAGDKETLNGFLYKEGTPADLAEMFAMMQGIPAGSKVTSIELVAPTEADVAKFNKTMTLPDGRTFVMSLKPYKQLVVVSESKDASGSGKKTSKNPVAEKDGKLVIPLPVPAKK